MTRPSRNCRLRADEAIDKCKRARRYVFRRAEAGGESPAGVHHFLNECLAKAEASQSRAAAIAERSGNATDSSRASAAAKRIANTRKICEREIKRYAALPLVRLNWPDGDYKAFAERERATASAMKREAKRLREVAPNRLKPIRLCGRLIYPYPTRA